MNINVNLYGSTIANIESDSNTAIINAVAGIITGLSSKDKGEIKSLLEKAKGHVLLHEYLISIRL